MSRHGVDVQPQGLTSWRKVNEKEKKKTFKQKFSSMNDNLYCISVGNYSMRSLISLCLIIDFTKVNEEPSRGG